MALDTVTLTRFKELMRQGSKEIAKLPSMNVEADGVYLFTFITPSTGFLKNQIQHLANESNKARPSST
jgi:hypothetical protein